MFRWFAWMLLGCTCLSLPACSSSGDYVPPPSEEAMTSEAKQMILDFVATAKRSPQEGAAMAPGLYESLEPLSDPKLDGVKATAKELADHYANSAARSELTATLDKLAKQAEAL